jgi:flagellin
MPQVINTNMLSLNTQRNLSQSQASQATAIQRLSSGLRINTAKDDAAGLAISERFTSQIRGLNQATRNAQDAISLSQTAEGAMGSISDNLQRIRELAVQAANGTNGSADRLALDQEVQQMIAETQRVATQTQFNGINLIDGTFSGQTFQIGANQNQTVSVSSISNMQTTALGSNLLTTGGTAMNRANAAAADVTATLVAAETDLTLTTATGGTTAAISYAANAGANAIADAINTAGANVGLSATATNSATLSSLASAGTVTMTLNGQAISAAVTTTSDLSALAAAINGVSGTTGVSASFADSNNRSSMSLTTTDGRDITMLDFNNSGATKTVSLTGGNGTAVTLTGGAATDSTRIVGKVDIYSSQGAITAALANTDAFASAGATSSFSSVGGLSVTTSSNAQAALRVVDDALRQVNGARASLGAIQNRFESTIDNLKVSSENLTASRSRVLDADFAEETSKLTRSQILQQAGTAMLAQANAAPQSVLALLRG